MEERRYNSMNEFSLKITLLKEGKEVTQTYNDVYNFKIGERRVNICQFVGEYGRAKVNIPMKNIRKIVIDVNVLEDTRG